MLWHRVHKNSVSVCVLPGPGQTASDLKKRRFPTFTRDLKQLRSWLKRCQVTEIAMECIGDRSGICWRVSLRSCCW
jgi:hypothetical protein